MLSLCLIFRLGILQGLLTPAICYMIGTYYHHLDTIPMISDCGIYTPERYVFRLGCITAACLIGTAGIGIYSSNNNNYNKSLTGLVLSMCASIGLALLGAINIQENWTLHTVSAVIFLISFGLYVDLIAFQSRNRPSFVFTYRLIFAIINTVTLIVFLILHCDFDRMRIYIAILEWLFFVNGLSSLFLFSQEFKNTHLSWSNSNNSPSNHLTV